MRSHAWEVKVWLKVRTPGRGQRLQINLQRSDQKIRWKSRDWKKRMESGSREAESRKVTATFENLEVTKDLD